MEHKEFLKLFEIDPNFRIVAEKIKPNEAKILQVKGLTGSMDALLMAVCSKINKQNYLIVVNDKEEAAFLHTDLSNLLDQESVLLYPSSYKRIYEFEEVENANILRRAEILNQINNKDRKGLFIITYPEAMAEKVINKKSLIQHTFTAASGTVLDYDFVSELLISYDFEKTDIVYEPGQFSIRGGILDIYSYANELPFRLEMIGDEVESIRTFDPATQLSQEEVKNINIIPNIQTKLLMEERESFFKYLPKNTKIWFSDVEYTLDTIQQFYEQSVEKFEDILKPSNGTTTLTEPKLLFENQTSFLTELENWPIIEFGSRFYFEDRDTVTFNSGGQSSFNKDFDLIIENLQEFKAKDYTLIIASEALQQHNRLKTIFEEHDQYLKVHSLMTSLRKGFIDHDSKVLLYTDHQLFDRYHRYKDIKKHAKSKALTLKELRSLNTGDYVTHIDHGVGRFAGLEKVNVAGKMQEAIRLVFKDDDLLYVSIHSIHKISKYKGKEGTSPEMNKLGSPEWENKKKKVKKKLKDIAHDLIKLYSQRKKAVGYTFSPDSFLQAELESSFIYQDTPDQAKATEDVKRDMELPNPMDRLVCGDVGFGKTEVAIRAAFKAATDSKQVAVLVPTTILAMQHYRTFAGRMKGLPVTVEYINRFRTAKEVKDILKRTAEGKVDILIGTHKIVGKDVKFKDLGLMIIDEEQKFGVKTKDKLKEFKVNVDVLTLTATPIPRTLHFSLMGARDLSVIATPPPNRQTVTTEIHTFNEKIFRDAVSYEIRRGGQVFIVHNRIADIDSLANIVLKLVPDVRICVAHGQMEGSKLEKIMVAFMNHEYDVMVSTNIIESGLDIPNANTILINSAQNFGLSDLHQMRGRVGRSNRKAFCYLVSPPTQQLSSESRKRLSAMEEFSDLGDGFKVAMRDLDIRGAGNLLGAEQTGFINDLGFDTYHKMLDEAVDDLKKTEFADLFKEELSKKVEILVKDCSLETDLELLIPDSYVKNINERLSLYTRLDGLKNEEGILKFEKEIKDRFGEIPTVIFELFKTVRIRWCGERLGIEKILIKKENMKLYLLSGDNNEYYQSNIFGQIIAFVGQNKKAKMKEYKNRIILTFNEIRSIDIALDILKQMLKE